MIRQPQCRNWLHFYRITCRLSKIGRKKVYYIDVCVVSSYVSPFSNSRDKMPVQYLNTLTSLSWHSERTDGFH